MGLLKRSAHVNHTVLPLNQSKRFEDLTRLRSGEQNLIELSRRHVYATCPALELVTGLEMNHSKLTTARIQGGGDERG